MKLRMELGPNGYDIILKPGALKSLGLLANLAGKVMLVSDDGVPRQYIDAVAAQCAAPTLHLLPQGEEAKTPEQWQSLVAHLLCEDFSRQDLVVAVGGGAVGDVAGFAAATCRHGLPLCLVPTTTMAQADAAVGGRTNLHLGTKLDAVGVYHQPQLVLADPNTLATLGAPHWESGLAQALKMALTGNRQLFEILESEDARENIERILFLCLRYKKDVVEQDEAGTGARRLLLFGYPIGQAIQAACAAAGTPLPHGACIALGMLPMIESRSLLRRCRNVMEKLGLPTTAPCTREEILAQLSPSLCQNGRCTVARVKTLGEGYLEEIDYEELKLLV